jgi:DNA-binding transcriptional ArsR family regulator
MPRESAALLGAAPVFAALGDEQRLRIVARLSKQGALSIARITEGTQVTRQAVTKHLRVLEEAGLARSEKLGREAVWSIEPAPLRKARLQLEQIAAQWDDAIERLRSFVEDEES